MAFRFRVSKYKNLSLKLPEPGSIRANPKFNLSSFNFSNTASNWIASSGYLYAHLYAPDDIAISSFLGERSKILQTIHFDSVSDFDFNPFHDDILSVSGSNGSIGLYRIPIYPSDSNSVSNEGQVEKLVNWVPNNINNNNNDEQSSSSATTINSIKFHPTIDFMLTAATDSSVKLYDVNHDSNDQQPLQTVSISEDAKLKSFSLDYYGKIAALNGFTENKSIIELADFRCPSSEKIASNVQNDQIFPNSDSRVLFLDGPSVGRPYLITSNVNKQKHRIVSVWDIRSFNSTPISTSVDFQTSTNVFIPLFDPDTGLIYFVLRNGNCVAHFELDTLIGSNTFEISSNLSSIPNSIKGATLASKRCLDVMNTEINRILTLSTQLVYPLSYHIQRKSYQSFHDDLFPQTKSPDTKFCQLSDFLDNNNFDMPTISLDPGVNRFPGLFRCKRKIGNANLNSQIDETQVIIKTIDDLALKLTKSTSVDEESSIAEDDLIVKSVTKPKPLVPVKPRIAKSFTVAAKCKYLKGAIANRATHITNVTNICKKNTTYSESFKANEKFGFFPMGTVSNQLAIIELDKPQRLSGALVPHIICSDVMADFCLDPFDSNRVAIAQQSGEIEIFLIPENFPNENQIVIEECSQKLIGSQARVNLILFHPLANGILASSGSDDTILVWNITTQEIKQSYSHSSPILAMAWNRFKDGAIYIAFVDKEKNVNIVDFRNDDSPKVIQTGKLPYSGKNSRICWVLNDQMLLVTAFNGLSERQFYLYDAANLSSGPLVEYGINVSPSVMVPYYDEDTRTLFLTSKGDAIIYAFELSASGPNMIVPLSHFETPTPHQAISFLSKNVCNIQQLEFARGYRLTLNSIEPFNFVIPRLHLEYFHDDLFPPTRSAWLPVFTAENWFESDKESLSNTPIPEISLKPTPEMENYSDVKDSLLQERDKKAAALRASKEAASGNAGCLIEQNSRMVAMNRQTSDDSDEDLAQAANLAEIIRIGKEKQQKLVEQISGKVEFTTEPKPLKNVEGVDSDEWEE